MKLSKTYEPDRYESDIYKLWETSGAFSPRKDAEPFVIIMPPPNANANLHTGHSLFMSIQDVVTRYQRMLGKSALWLPGADHAGFETWVVYEKKLASEGKSRFDFKREELYSQVWDFVQQNKSNYESQFRRLGASCDWSRFTFTLDEKVVKSSYQIFKRLWDDGLIYRGERIVNFCTMHGTSFSDYEVIHRDQDSKLWHIEYPLTDGSGSVVVATTRPETMLGDTAVAVNPKDSRYQNIIGKTVKLPLTHREIPIIADDFVDMDFGTGAVKVTPAHDPNDFEMAKRHDLPLIHVINTEGLTTHEVPPKFAGLSVEKARETILEELKNNSALKQEVDYSHSVGHCYKCDSVIEPLVKDQWFVSMKPLAESAIESLEQNNIEFFPKSKKQAVIEYLKNIKDWNISRQIAWGIPIPAFQNINNPDEWIFDERVDQEIIERGGEKFHRDPDVFDTWFSSGQWPYVTLGYPDDEDFKKFYPTNLMETGGEILFSWVARMIMLGLYTTKQIPFKEVYIHGNVLAEDGTKMSKSKGNTVNPMEEIDKFGSDALRIGMISGRIAGAHQAYAPAKVIGGRNFANKLWNIARYIEDAIGENFEFNPKPEPKNIADVWILSKINHACHQITKHLDNYQFSMAFETIYELIWNDLADWYLEASKSSINKEVLAYSLDTVLRLSHPFAPFVTETIWQTLDWTHQSLLITQAWPQPKQLEDVDRDFEDIKGLVSEIRQVKTTLKLSKPVLKHRSNELLKANRNLVIKLAGLDDLTIGNEIDGLRIISGKIETWLVLDNETLASYNQKLQSDQLEVQKQIDLLESRLKNDNYLSKAPEPVVDETRSKLQMAKDKLAKINDQLSKFD